MSRSIYLTIAASLVLAGGNLANGQAVQTNKPAASPTTSSAPAADDLAKLQAENAALKKQVADAARTIAQLQSELAQAGIHHRAATAPAAEPPPAAPGVVDNNAPVAAVPAQAADTSATPAGPQRALPLDATNANVTAAAPGTPATDAGPSRSYTIVKGDSLWKIAHKMYPGDTKNGVDKIQEANKDAIGGKPLKIGQVLIIPQ
jgi:nucleoid-associated protein YgaU